MTSFRDQSLTPSDPPVFTRRRALSVASGVLGLTALVAACSDDGPRVVAGPSGRPDKPNPPSGASGVVVNVQSIDNTFRPDHIEIAVGTEVVWTNGGRNQHDILPVEGTDWGVQPEDFPPGATYGHVFTEPGEVHYYCTIHGNMTLGMTGTILVR